MAVQTLTLIGKKYVLVPESEYRALQKKAANGTADKPRRLTRQDRGDIAESIRRLAEPGKRVTQAELKRSLGL
ncbi:MAG TPA: hypothetical protein VK324_03015 [Tepidisphaeraceae bacterium]|nr:hypothetical protein [Tepidisphaeraceae bacterium]